MKLPPSADCRRRFTFVNRHQFPIFKKQKIDLPLITDRKFEVVFVYEGDSGRYDYTHLQDDTGTFRGLYGSNDEESYKDTVKEFGIGIPPGRDPNLD